MKEMKKSLSSDIDTHFTSINGPQTHRHGTRYNNLNLYVSVCYFFRNILEFLLFLLFLFYTVIFSDLFWRFCWCITHNLGVSSIASELFNFFFMLNVEGDNVTCVIEEKRRRCETKEKRRKDEKKTLNSSRVAFFNEMIISLLLF